MTVQTSQPQHQPRLIVPPEDAGPTTHVPWHGYVPNNKRGMFFKDSPKEWKPATHYLSWLAIPFPNTREQWEFVGRFAETPFGEDCPLQHLLTTVFVPKEAWEWLHRWDTEPHDPFAMRFFSGLFKPPAKTVALYHIRRLQPALVERVKAKYGKNAGYKVRARTTRGGSTQTETSDIFLLASKVDPLIGTMVDE